MTGATPLLQHFDTGCLRELGYACVASERTEMDLVGPTEMQLWRSERAAREVRIICALGGGPGPAALSVLIRSDDGSFTYTDWTRAVEGEETPRAPASPDPGYIAAYGAQFCRSARGLLRPILAGERWADVPTYRGVLD